MRGRIFGRKQGPIWLVYLPLTKIYQSLYAGEYRDFDRAFLPTQCVIPDRWASVKTAEYR
jgi:hypothetical protein